MALQQNRAQSRLFYLLIRSNISAALLLQRVTLIREGGDNLAAAVFGARDVAVDIAFIV